MLKIGGYQSGDLAVAAHHSPGTDGDDDGVVVSDDGGSDEKSSEQEVHHVPTRRQLAEQRSRRELFRRSLETASRRRDITLRCVRWRDSSSLDGVVLENKGEVTILL